MLSDAALSITAFEDKVSSHTKLHAVKRLRKMKSTTPTKAKVKETGQKDRMKGGAFPTLRSSRNGMRPKRESRGATCGSSTLLSE
jgi:hypothetical protein